MISRVTGEIAFEDSLRFAPQEALAEEHLRFAVSHHPLDVPGWSHHALGVHASDRGDFEIEAVSDRNCRIQMILLAHSHPFYQTGTEMDSERRTFHEGVLEADLSGQREFSWGEAFCRLDRVESRDWIVIIYQPGSLVPRPELFPSPHLHEHHPAPALNDADDAPG